MTEDGELAEKWLILSGFLSILTLSPGSQVVFKEVPGLGGEKY